MNRSCFVLIFKIYIYLILINSYQKIYRITTPEKSYKYTPYFLNKKTFFYIFYKFYQNWQKKYQIYIKKSGKSRRLPLFSLIFKVKYYLVALSRRFIIEKINNADTKHKATSIVHNAHNGSPPQSIPITETR